VWFAHEPLRPLDLAAMLCVLGGVYLLQTGRRVPVAARLISKV
jgi:drug/metabolite transporter (DMT)-like permease